MIPLRDENPTQRPAVLTVTFIVICILVFLWQISAGGGANQNAFSFGFIPAVFFGYAEAPAGVPGPLTLFTSMFMHGGWMHLGGNMLFLWIFGNNIEDELGHVRFIIFYLVCGIAATLAHALTDTSSMIPLVGASGAISGVMAAYVVLYPRAKIVSAIVLGFYFHTFKISAIWYVGIWFAIQAVNALASSGGGGGTAWWAHIGGFIAGLILIFVLRPRQAKSLHRPPDVRRGPWG